MGSDCCCCCCCCCRQKPPPPPTPRTQLIGMHHVNHVVVSPIFGPITTQPPATANVITTQSAIATITTTQPPGTANITWSPPLVITENRQRTREPLHIARHGNNIAIAVPTAPPAPEATEHYWTKNRLAHTEPSVMVSDGFYAGRVVAGKDTLPAILETKKVVDPRSGVVMEQFVAAHFFYKNQAGSTEDFEVLSCSKTSWQPAMGGYVAPENAIVCGRTASGRPLYFGRAFDEGKYHFGTADPEEGLLYSMANGGTWYGCVRTSQHFDILVAA